MPVQRLKAGKAELSKPKPSTQGVPNQAGQHKRAVSRHSPVPDFRHLHSAWEARLADSKAANRAKATRPEVGVESDSFFGCTGSTACMSVISVLHKSS